MLSSASVKIGASFSWHQYSAVLPYVPKNASRVSFELVLNSAGEMLLDSVSLIQSDAIAGVLRRDIVEHLRLLKPGFLRAPGYAHTCMCTYMHTDACLVTEEATFLAPGHELHTSGNRQLVSLRRDPGTTMQTGGTG